MSGWPWTLIRAHSITDLPTYRSRVAIYVIYKTYQYFKHVILYATHMGCKSFYINIYQDSWARTPPNQRYCISVHVFCPWNNILFAHYKGMTSVASRKTLVLILPPHETSLKRFDNLTIELKDLVWTKHIILLNTKKISFYMRHMWNVNGHISGK